MNARSHKAEIITFKVDASLVNAMKGIPNRSDFIRTAVLTALESVCPVCRGTGILTPNQKKHWDAFAADHRLAECEDCHEFLIVCSRKPSKDVHNHAARPRARGARTAKETT